MNTSRIRLGLLRDRRGVSALEYALLICAILLVGAIGFRLLGRGETQAVNHGVKTLEGSLEKGGGNVDPANNSFAAGDPSDGTDPYDDPDPSTFPRDPPPKPPEHKSGGGGFWHGVGNFFKGAILGDFAGDTGWQGTLGQVVVGFIPIVGDVAAVRDVVHGGIDVAQGKPGGWEEVGAAGISLIPEVGGVLKAGAKGAKEAHAVEEGAAGVEKGAAKDGEKGAAKDGEKAPDEGGKFSQGDAKKLIDDSEGRTFGNNVGHASDHIPENGQDPKVLAESRRKPNGNPYQKNSTFESSQDAEQAMREIMNSRADDLAKLPPSEVLRGDHPLEHPMEGWKSINGAEATKVPFQEVTYAIGKLPDGTLHLIHLSPNTP